MQIRGERRERLIHVVEIVINMERKAHAIAPRGDDNAALAELAD